MLRTEKKRCTGQFALAWHWKYGPSCRENFMNLRLLFCAELVSASQAPGLRPQAQSTVFFVTGRNNVGIGTTTPSNHLVVAAHVGSEPMRAWRKPRVPFHII
jgi:hypothetical protein